MIIICYANKKFSYITKFVAVTSRGCNTSHHDVCYNLERKHVATERGRAPMNVIVRPFWVLFVMALAFAAPARSQEKVTEVRVAMLAPSALLWLHAIARDQGFYAERKISVKELIAGSSPTLLQAVSSGSVEAGMSLGDVVIRAIDQGAPVIMTGAILEKTILRLVGGTGVTTTKELEGAAVTAGAVEGGTANLLRFQLQRGGVNPRNVKMVALTNSKDRVVALGNGQVKGALLIAPFDTLAEREKMKILDVYTEPYVQTPLIVNRELGGEQ